MQKQRMKNGKIKYFSMFTGVGGFELGLKRANDSKPLSKIKQDRKRGNGTSTLLRSRSNPAFHCVGMSEFNKYSSQVLKYKFPNIKNWGDCTKINPRGLPDFDLLCGGFPCQAFSIAGKRKGFEDTRGTMFFEVARILKVKRPKIVLLENVKGLLNHNKGETFRVILQTLDELGYEVQWMVLNSKFFGVPQNRERVFIIGNLRGTGRSEILPFREDDELFDKQNESNEGQPQAQLSTTIQSKTRADGTFVKETKAIHNIYGGFGEGPRFSDISPTIRTAKGGGHLPSVAVLTPDRAEKRQNGRRFKGPGEPSFTLTGQDIHGVTDGIKIRKLTPIECERLQGFPDNWTEFGIDEKGNKMKMSDTQRYKQMGNAVTTNVIKAVANKL